MSRRRSSDSPIYDFLTFRLMITPMVIAVLFSIHDELKAANDRARYTG
ncbi:hypothetical protein [Gemmata sp.]